MGNWFFLVIAMLVAFIASGDRQAYGVFVIPLSEAFDLSRSQAVLPLALTMVVWGIAQPFVGSLMDTYGPRKVILGALTLMGTGFAASAGAQNLVQLTLGYGVLVGLSSTGLAVAAFSVMISRRFGQQNRGKAIGFGLAGIPLGTMVFAPFISALVVNSGWRWAFLAMSGMVLLVGLPLAWAFLREPPRQPGSHPQTLKSGSLFSRDILQAVKTRAYWLLLLAYFGCGSAGLFMQGHIAAMGREFGFSPQVGALALGLVGAGGAVGAMVGGWAADRYGRYNVLVVGYLLRSVGFFLMAFFVSSKESFLAIAVLTGLPIFLTITVTQAVVYEVFGSKIAGRMLGLIFVLHQVGSTIGPYFGGRLFEMTDSYRLPLLIGGGILIFSALCSWLLKDAARRSMPAEAAPRPVPVTSSPAP